VVLGKGCQVGNHVSLLSGTRIGNECKILHGAIIGEIPQDLKFEGEDSTVEIGDGVTIREYVTVNRGTKALGTTRIGRDSLLMAYVHVPHDCQIGENVIIANGVQMAGHVIIDDWANISGLVPIHQFCRIGEHAFVAGGYRVVQDIPPYILAAGEPLEFSGINLVGLRRRGFSAETRGIIKKAYQIIYRSSLNTSEALKKIKADLPSTDEIEEIVTFVENSDRGIL